jgi:hypothetical protein
MKLTEWREREGNLRRKLRGFSARISVRQSCAVSRGWGSAWPTKGSPARYQEYCRKTEQHSDYRKPIELHTTSRFAWIGWTVQCVFLEVEPRGSHLQLHVTNPVLQNLLSPKKTTLTRYQRPATWHTEIQAVRFSTSQSPSKPLTPNHSNFVLSNLSVRNLPKLFQAPLKKTFQRQISTSKGSSNRGSTPPGLNCTSSLSTGSPFQAYSRGRLGLLLPPNPHMIALSVILSSTSKQTKKPYIRTINRVAQTLRFCLPLSQNWRPIALLKPSVGKTGDMPHQGIAV